MQKYELAVPATIEAQEREAHRREVEGLATFVTVVTLIVACGVCVLAAPIWTVIFPAAGCLAVMRKAGWV